MLVGEDLVEEHLGVVVSVQLDLAFVCIGVGDRLIEQLDQHGEVVSELGVKTLHFSHIVIIKDITGVFVEEVVVIVAQQFNFDEIDTFIWSFDKNLDIHGFGSDDIVADLLSHLGINNMHRQRDIAIIEKSIAANCLNLKQQGHYINLFYLLRLGSVLTT